MSIVANLNSDLISILAAVLYNRVMKPDDAFRQDRLTMVERQIASRGVRDERVLAAMRAVPREAFIPDELRDEAYEDRPLPVGAGQTISQPYIVALMTSYLRLVGNEKVLEIGTGSGYQAAILGRLAESVHTVERVAALAYRAEDLFRRLGYTNIHVHLGDGSLGWPKAAPYDRVIVTAAAPALPEELTDQLKLGGRLIIPVGERWHQMLEGWRKTAEGLEKDEVLPVAFVPLRGKKGWQD